MTIKIHYCGGCNPCYERAAFASRLKHDFSAFSYKELAGSGENPPAFPSIALCGCSCRCLLRNGDTYEGLVVSGPADFPKIYTALQSLKGDVPG